MGPSYGLAVLQTLLQHGSLSWSTALQEWTSPAWVPRMLHALPENLLLCELRSTGRSTLQGISTCCGMRSSMGCSVDICCTVVFDGLHGGNMCHHSLYRGLQGNLCSGAWSTSSHSFFADPGVCRAVSLTFFLLLSPTAAAQHFLPFLKCIFTEAPSLSLMGSALASSGSILELAGTGSGQHEGNSWSLLTEVTPAAPRPPLPTKTLPHKYNTSVHTFFY